MTANLSKELRKKYGRRNLGIRKNDKVKIMAGEFRNKEGKVTAVLLKKGKITIEGIQRKKRDGSKVDVKINPSNVQIIEADISDKKRGIIIKKEINIKQEGEKKK
jgi:large subunit ribosomal protein L24